MEFDILGSLHPLSFVADDTALPPVGEAAGARLGSDTHALFDFARICSGFVGARLRCEGPSTVYLVFDEQRGRMEASDYALGVGAVALELGPGRYDFESIDSYSLRYLRVVATGGAVVLEDLWLREYAHPTVDDVSLDSDDPELIKILEAARETFRANALDLFMDCPSRERGGYPCDGYFTARVEKLLTGETRVERNFLENFLLPDSFRNIPPGMLPHCYPSDRNMKGRFIPNWALWLFIQFEDYVERSGDRSSAGAGAAAGRGAVRLPRHLPQSGALLEDLEGWVFVEHSPANDYTAGVNHPTNLVYAQALDASRRCLTVMSGASRRLRCGRLCAVNRGTVAGSPISPSASMDGCNAPRRAARHASTTLSAFGIADPDGSMRTCGSVC